jgi:YegS/Rv2252/BmrU family lipid kinase
MKYLIIYNPNAANGVASKRIDDVTKNFEDSALDYTIELTKGPGHAIEIAEAVTGDYDVVVAAGGDGTANETLNGLMRHKASSDTAENAPAFAILAIGRGNDFAYGIGMPRGYSAGCAALKADRRKRIDVGMITGPEVAEPRYFGNGIGMGFDTIVGLEAAKIRWAQGFLGYLLGALKTIFFFYNAPMVSIKTDSFEEVRPMLQVSVMNGRRMGGAFFMAPNSEIDDGKFDLCIAGEPKRREMLGLLVQFLKGSQEENRHITFSRSKKVTVTSADNRLVVHADGETICTEGAEIELEVIPRAIEIVYGD